MRIINCISKLTPMARFLHSKDAAAAALSVALGIAMCSSIALAQSGAGAIQGTVKDLSGAVIPGAAIHVVNYDTGQSLDTQSNGAGFYEVPSLFVGSYTLTFSAPGMRKYETTIHLQVAQTAVISPSLTPGSVTQQVTVTGYTTQLATYNSGTISSVLENSRISQLPMNGRSLTTLTEMTTPGIEGGRANGNMPAALEYTQDGASMAALNFGGTVRLPDPDTVQEVRVETTDSGANFAVPATAIITTKSGTNQLHGSFFETAENNYFGIAKAREDPSNLKSPHYVENEFGASVGGPIILPRYNGRDKSFFFFAYERFSLRQNLNELVTVPTVAMRNGDFSGLVDSQGRQYVLYDSKTTNPVTFQRQPFPNNQIPLSRMSPLAKTLDAITPLPSTSDNPLIQSNLTTPGINNSTAPTITFRLDHRFNENNTVYLRYTSDTYTEDILRNYPGGQPPTIAGGGLPAGASNLEERPRSVYSFALGYTHIFSPTFFSETVLSNQWESEWDEGGGPTRTNYETELGLPNNFGETGFPQIGLNLITAYAGTQWNYGVSQIITNIDENLTKILGRHQMYFGGRYRHERIGALPDRTEDQVNFDGEATGQLDPTSGKLYSALPFTGNQNADMFLGAASSYVVHLNPPYLHMREQEFDTYFQDNIHVNSSLTMNLGVRWEAHPAMTTANNELLGFDIKNKAIVLGEPIAKLIALGVTTQSIITNLENLGVVFENTQQAGYPSAMINSYDFTLGPRIGVAYAPFGSRGTVFRGGFGRYIYPIPTRNFYASMKVNEPFAGSYYQDYTSADQSPDGQPNYLLRSPQTVVAGQNSSGVVNSSGTNAILPGISQFSLNPRYPPSYVTQANFTIEQPLWPSSVIRLSYIWDHGSNLDQQNEYNNHPSNYVWEEQTGTVPPIGYYSSVATGPYDNKVYSSSMASQDRSGWSNDNAFQLNYQRIYKAGYAYQLFYVFSRAMRVGGNAFRDSRIYPVADYAPGLAPTTDPHALNKFQNYQIDSAIPEHHIGFNGIVDLPIGQGKLLFGHVNRFMEELIGGYQIAGDGNVYSAYFKPYSGNWGPTSPLRVYKNKYKIQDCRSGVCHPGHLWFNGFISPRNSSKVTGLPSYQPYQTPLDMVPNTPNYLTNNVLVPLANGESVNTPYSPGPGLNPYSKTYLHGPFNWTSDLSLFKVFQIKKTVFLRVNIDAFNAFNVQGSNNPDPHTGIQDFLSSANTPRQIQFSARLTF